MPFFLVLVRFRFLTVTDWAIKINSVSVSDDIYTFAVLLIGVFRISQLIGFLCFIVGVVLLIINLEKAHKKELSEVAYESVYSKAQALVNNETAPTAEKEVAEADTEEAEPETEDISDKLKNLFDDESDK